MCKVQVVLVDPGSCRHEINEPIGIGALASALKGHLGSQVTTEQFFVPFTGWPDQQVLGRTDILGISTPLGSLSALNSLVATWKAIPEQQRPLLVVGGLLATFAPDAILGDFPDAILVIGEGEEALAKLADLVLSCPREHWRPNLANTSIPNLAYRVGDQVVRTHRRNIDLGAAQAPDRPFLKELMARGGIVRAEASRGCSYGRCTFCAIQHKYCDEISWRGVEINRILQELGDLSRVGARHPYFTDEDFIGNNPHRAIALASAIEAGKSEGHIAADLTLYLDMRAASILARGNAGRPSGLTVLRALRAAGLREVFVGIESGAGAQVTRYRKPATADRNLRALQLLKELDLEVDVGFIFFDPEMTLNEAAENLAFLKRADLWQHDARMTKELRLEAGTPLVDTYRQKGLIAGPMDVDELTFPYRWRDARVEAVHFAFRAWEGLDAVRVYELQAATRGEVPTEAIRRARRRILGQVRAVELDALQTIVSWAQEGGNPSSLDLGHFTRRRSDILDEHT